MMELNKKYVMENDNLGVISIEFMNESDKVSFNVDSCLSNFEEFFCQFGIKSISLEVTESYDPNEEDCTTN